MTDKELIARLRDLGRSFPNWQDGIDAADRIEALVKERDRQYDENVNRIHQQALAENRAERLAALLDRAVNGPWLDGDLERARAALKGADHE